MNLRRNFAAPMSTFKSTFKKKYKNTVRGLNHRNSPIIRWYYQKFWTPKPGSIAALFDDYSKKKNGDIHFIQIGANDGMEHDPLLKFIRRDGWKGVLIEPQPHVFQQLEYLHENSKGIQLLNAAVGHEDGEQTMFKISFSKSRWATGLASFNKESIERAIESGHVESCAKAEGTPLPNSVEEYITTEEVSCVSFSTVLEKYESNTVHLLQIDTEGFDFEIIKMVDFNKMKPALISFEISHLSSTDRKSCFDLLHEQGYSIYPHGRDALAYQPGTIKPMQTES